MAARHDRPRPSTQPSRNDVWIRLLRLVVSRDLLALPAEIFIFNYKVNSQADTNAKDAAVVCSLALLRDSRGNANGPLGHALDLLAENTR